MKKVATLFGGAMNNTETPEYKDTVKIGNLLARSGYHIKNGGYRGMMEAVSKGASENKAGYTCTGYTCSTFASTKGNKYLTKTVVADDLYDRLRYLIEGTSLFIVQRGGIGTLSEICLALDLIRKKKKEDRPKVILVGLFWVDIFHGLQTILSEKDTEGVVVVKDYIEFEKELNK